MTQNEKNFIIENRDFYINGFVDYWFDWNDYIPTEEDIKKEFKNFMYEYKNIKANLTFKVFKDILEDIKTVFIKIAEYKEY